MAALAAGLIGGAAAAAGPFAALAGIERGRWQFKVIGGATGRDACVPDPLRLIQFNHPGPRLHALHDRGRARSRHDPV